MKNCNWMLVARKNKVRDIVAYYKATLPRLSEERIVAVASINNAGMDDVVAEWSTIPQAFKGVHKQNLGCA